MNMKKTIILLGLLLVMNYTAFAEQRGIFMDFHGDINPKKRHGSKSYTDETTNRGNL